MNNEEIRILKTATCSSLSGRSTLTYEIGCDKNKAIYLRIAENTGSGIFSKDWIPLAQLDPLLSSEEKPITSGMLRSLFQSKSINTIGFVMAALIAEGLLKVSDERLRTYERIDPAKFKKDIQALMDAPLPVAEKPTKVKKGQEKGE